MERVRDARTGSLFGLDLESRSFVIRHWLQLRAIAEAAPSVNDNLLAVARSVNPAYHVKLLPYPVDAEEAIYTFAIDDVASGRARRTETEDYEVFRWMVFDYMDTDANLAVPAIYHATWICGPNGEFVEPTAENVLAASRDHFLKWDVTVAESVRRNKQTLAAQRLRREMERNRRRNERVREWAEYFRGGPVPENIGDAASETLEENRLTRGELGVLMGAAV